jgi:hypothetical protein
MLRLFDAPEPKFPRKIINFHMIRSSAAGFLRLPYFLQRALSCTHIRVHVPDLRNGRKSTYFRDFRIVFWDVLPCKIIVGRRFRGTCCLHHWPTIILHGSTSQKAILNFILAAVRTWNLTYFRELTHRTELRFALVILLRRPIL